MNHVFIMGNLGQDPQQHQSMASFSIATSSKGADGTEYTEWHRCITFKRTAEIAMQYLKKGSKVFIEGSLRTREWGEPKRSTTEIVVHKLTMLSTPDKPKQITGRDYMSAKNGDDIPF